MKRIIRPLKLIIPIVAITCTAVFTPWDTLWLWAALLPDTVKEQVDDAVNHNLEGIIVYIDKKGKEPEFYSAGLKDSENKNSGNSASPVQNCQYQQIIYRSSRRDLLHVSV